MKAQSIFVSIVASLALGTVACAPATSADLSAELEGAPYEVENVEIDEGVMSEDEALDEANTERGEGAQGALRVGQCNAQQERCVQVACQNAGGTHATNCQPTANGGATSTCHGAGASFTISVGPRYFPEIQARGI